MNEAAKKNEVATEARDEGGQVALANADSIMAVISRAASDPSTDVDKLERLMGLYERMRENTAKQEFAAALNAAQKEIPLVDHNSKNDHTKSTYADLEAVSKAADPIIQKHGFSLSFGTGKSELQGHYRVTCDVTHDGGHTQHYYADVPADTAGAQGKANKNATQGFGSTMTYGRRYLKCMIFDIKTGEVDDDGMLATRAELPRMSAQRGKRYINYQAISDDIENASDRQLSNLENWIADECGWMPSGWQRQFLDEIRERDEQLEHQAHEAVSANESLDRQFAETMREDDLPPETRKMVREGNTP